jgi:hypothetical protein
MSRFSLRVQVEIAGVSDNGGYLGDRLNVGMTAEIFAETFDELAAVIGRFHGLAGAIHDEQAPAAERGAGVMP